MGLSVQRKPKTNVGGKGFGIRPHPGPTRRASSYASTGETATIDREMSKATVTDDAKRT